MTLAPAVSCRNWGTLRQLNAETLIEFDEVLGLLMFMLYEQVDSGTASLSMVNAE
jgi:hypothetical protein